MSEKITMGHRQRKAIVYVRQSSAHQVTHRLESQRLQYAMRQRVQRLGWNEVETIDDDLGLSAQTTAKRDGFQRMVAEVCMGKVGAIAAREVSRFARNNRDWHQLIEVCSMVDTLLIDHEAIYNPRLANDRLLLGVKGSLSEYELELLRQRAVEARWQKAKRGELVLVAPVGYVKAGEGKLEKVADLRVQKAIEMVFDKFFELGSTRQVLFWMLGNDLSIPAQRHTPTGWEQYWKRPYYQSISRIVTDPTYAGAYVYGKTADISRVTDGRVEKKRTRKPFPDWGVLLRDHHEGYISWEQFEKIQAMLSQNSSKFAKDQPGAAKKGPALLSGLLRCRRCGRKLLVAYGGRNGTVPRYECRRGRLDNGDPKCISFGGVTVDEAVAREVLRAVQPCAIDAAILAADEETHKQDDVMGALLLEAKSARYAADRAWKQYDAADPENRLVVDELERRWNDALERVGELQDRIEHERQRQGEEPQEVNAESLLALADDLPRVWNDPDVDVRLKKRVLRTLIEEVVVDIDPAAHEVEVVIHWKGGVHTVLRVPRRRRGENRLHTSKDVVDAVRVLALVCPDDTIAAYLNRNKILTGRGNRWTRERVASLRSKRTIPVYSRGTKERSGWMNLTESAAYVGTSATTVRKAVERGELPGRHPLPDGPWILNRSDLDTFKRAADTPAAPHSEQLNLLVSAT